MGKGLSGSTSLALLTHGPALNGCRTPVDHRLSAALGAIEMLKTGCMAAYEPTQVLRLGKHRQWVEYPHGVPAPSE
jgi:hypothetical protein